MTGYSGWSYHPFRPFDYDRASPMIVRLAPANTSAELEWIGSGPAELLWAERGSDAWETMPVLPGTVSITGLKDNTEYEIYLLDKNGKRGETRLLRTGEAESVVVNYYHPEDTAHSYSGQYLGSPSLLRMPDNTLLASMDYFGKAGQNLTQIFRSEDDGATWRWLTDLFPCFWGKLFLHRGRLHMLGMSTEYGDLLLGASADGGATWGTPTVLARGAGRTGPGFHRAPTNPNIHGGRLWFAAEFGAWSLGYHASLTLSADENADLLDPSSWTLSPPVRVENHIIEGNLVITPDGGLVNILRHARHRAVMLRVDCKNPAAPQRFAQMIDFPPGDVKFELLRREGIYYAVGNRPPDPGAEVESTPRNVLALYRSTDLLRWEHVRDLINHAEMDSRKVGFQYPSCLLEGNEVLILSRTAWNGAHNRHDSNRMTLHRCVV